MKRISVLVLSLFLSVGAFAEFMTTQELADWHLEDIQLEGEAVVFQGIKSNFEVVVWVNPETCETFEITRVKLRPYENWEKEFFDKERFDVLVYTKNDCLIYPPLQCAWILTDEEHIVYINDGIYGAKKDGILFIFFEYN